MTGLEKMKSQILDEANRSAGEILEQAKKEADAVMAEARKNAEAECQRISEKSEADAESLKGRAESSCDLQKRKAVLKAKQEVISEILKCAYKKMLASDTETYFDIIRKMLNKYVLPEEGEICFSSDDKKRMPDGFEKEIAAIAAAKGGKAAKALTQAEQTETFRVDLFSYMEESKKTVHLRQCLIPEEGNFPIKYMPYYFHKR